jgi:hypothetical protein
MVGVSVSFFSESLRALAEQHGDRGAAWEKMEELRLHLAEAERVYREMPPLEDAPQGKVPQ